MHGNKLAWLLLSHLSVHHFNLQVVHECLSYELALWRCFGSNSLFHINDQKQNLSSYFGNDDSSIPKRYTIDLWLKVEDIM